MQLCRLGSFNALEQTTGSAFWRRFLGTCLPSADTLGRVAECMDPEPLRQTLHHLYTVLKRAKALQAKNGLVTAILDGHETHATRNRQCDECLTRTIHTATGDIQEFYHRFVALSIVGDGWCMPLDLEPQRCGEDERAAARRLLERVTSRYPRAFDVVAGDALYACGDFFNYVKSLNKEAIAVLKDENRGLFKDAKAVWENIQPNDCWESGRERREIWDISGLESWPQCQYPVRVLRTKETKRVRSQLDKQEKESVATWVWVTTLSDMQAPSRTVTEIGHSRWKIENETFNELVNRWHGDHVYRHHGNAILILWLLSFVAANVFMAFYRRNLKPVMRARFDTLMTARLMLAELLKGCINTAKLPSGP